MAKLIDDLTERDFELHPVWRISKHVQSGGESSTETDEQTFSPWPEPITSDIIWPHSKILVAGSFHFADESEFPGYFQLVGTNWDDPLPPRKMRDGTFAKALQWSAKRGGGELSILSLIAPAVFAKGSMMDFHLRLIPQMRETHYRVFYSLFAKTPGETFPVRFETQYGTEATVNNGVIPGFYRFPLNKPHEITAGEDVWAKRPRR